MRHFPLFVALEGERIAIVGDGEAAIAKLRLFARTAARLRLFAPAGRSELFAAAAEFAVEIDPREPGEEDLSGSRLVVVALADPGRRLAIAERARRAGALVNVVDDPALSDVFVPAIVDRDPLVVAVGSEGEAPVLARLVRARIEAMLPERSGRLARFAGKLRPQVTARILPARERRRFFERLFEGPVASLLLAGREREAEELAQRWLEGDDGPRGWVRLLWVASEDPDLLTLVAAETLQQADLLVVDPEVPVRILDRARREARRIRRCAAPDCPQTDHAAVVRLVADAVRSGDRVVRLTSSPGRLFAEARALEASGIAVTALPATAAPLARPTDWRPTPETAARVLELLP
ncbi:Siroheme synthase [bacterium HR40]|nr:Siroheme synthase [bacterium HR40]